MVAYFLLVMGDEERTFWLLCAGAFPPQPFRSSPRCGSLRCLGLNSSSLGTCQGLVRFGRRVLVQCDTDLKLSSTCPNLHM